MSTSTTTSKKSLLIYGASQIVRVVSNGERFLRGTDQQALKDLAILTKKTPTDNLCLVSIGGVIRFVGRESDAEFKKDYAEFNFDQRIDAHNCCILPGFIDSHTHPVWSGDRINEFKMKLEGATYMQIHESGGGINFTVRHTTQSSEDELYQSLADRLKKFNRTGTTFVECKSGYGLEWDTEYKMLRVLTRAKRELKSQIGISNTYLAAHAVPKGRTADEATVNIVEYQMPKLKDLIDRNELDVDNVDVFCERGVFDVNQSEAILTQGQEMSLNANFHSDELYPLNSVEMAVRIKSKAVSHLEEISPKEISLLSKSETVGILLPTTAIIMQLKRPPAREMIKAGCIIALGSDFNPNAYCYAMPMVMNLACVDLRLSLNEALAAATINSAFALGVEAHKGSLEKEKDTDLVIIESDRWENIIYQMGAHDTLIKHVLVKGETTYSRTN